jgi:hypothetical protein
MTAASASVPTSAANGHSTAREPVVFPPDAREKIERGASEVMITEAAFKALMCHQHGYVAVGLIGVDCWHGKRSTTLLPGATPQIVG